MTGQGGSLAAHRANRRFTSPRARAAAHAQGLDLAQIIGSGPRGRVVVQDLPGPRRLGEPAAPPHMERSTRYEDVPNTLGRKLIARRLTESMQQAPHFYARVDCCVDSVLALRAGSTSRLAKHGDKLSINDFVIHAVAQALRDVPAVNVSFLGAAIRRYQQVHVAVAVAVAEGLATPVIADADSKGVVQIAREMRELATQARAGTLPAGASSGGTFSVSNLGAHGVREFTAVINPPQAAILAVGMAESRPLVRPGQIVAATMMTVTLSCDHRAIDGALAASWLAAFKGRLENPKEEDLWTSTQTTS
jgi:pyruvate dehydrogenase E2 component (dihydrolipoamide acetyltransferase)